MGGKTFNTQYLKVNTQNKMMEGWNGATTGPKGRQEEGNSVERVIDRAGKKHKGREKTG